MSMPKNITHPIPKIRFVYKICFVRSFFWLRFEVSPLERKAFAMSDLPTAFTETLSHKFGNRFSTAFAVREQKAGMAGEFKRVSPQAVVQCLSIDDVQAVVALCRDHRVPIIPHGSGSSLEGGLSAIHGGISLDLAGMDNILAVRQDDLDATVEAGVTREALNSHLRDKGLFFPLDPGANASLGGMAATRASGTNAVRYGTMRENVMALKVVMPNGDIVTTGTRARKSASGYDLTRLMIGSEGTLGVIVELSVRLYGIPEQISAATCAFATLSGAVSAVTDLLKIGVPLARVELMDALQIRASNAYSRLDMPELPHLFFEFHGSPTSVAEQVEMAQAVSDSHGGTGFTFAKTTEGRNQLWTARHNAYWAGQSLKPGSVVFPTDVCVPVGNLVACIEETAADIRATGLIAPLLGHVGDGNFHLTILVDPEDPASGKAASALHDRLIERAIAFDGTVTGEHGIGLGKQRFMEAEHGAGAVAMMVTIKQALDPLNIMNPGKVVPGILA
jgi:D-lactate dehydrogenase (cytochrome)